MADWIVWAEWLALVTISTMIIFPLFCIMDGVYGVPVFVISWLLSVFIFFIESENKSFDQKNRTVFSIIANQKRMRAMCYVFISMANATMAIYSGNYLYFLAFVFSLLTGAFYYLHTEESKTA